MKEEEQKYSNEGCKPSLENNLMTTLPIKQSIVHSQLYNWQFTIPALNIP